MFRYFASLGRLEVDTEAQRLTETLWDDDAGNTYRNVYEFDSLGNLVPVKAGT